ncbi:MAG: SirB1 family protein [Alphaproteobacteria bacterium]
MIDLGAFSHLKSFSEQSDEDFDLGRAAIELFSTDHPGMSLDKYFNHLQKVKKEVLARHCDLLGQGATDDVRTRLAALKHAVCDVHGYDVDKDHYEILESADFIRVLDRGCGHVNALCLIYIDVANQLGWVIEGVDFPGHFLCRMEKGGDRIIFDPAAGCRMLEAHDLRNLVKQSLGEEAELSTEYFNGMNSRDALVCLGNKIKSRYIEAAEYSQALNMTERLCVLAPDEYRLLLDAGVLYARTQNNEKAITCLEKYIERVPDLEKRQDAEFLLYELQNN